ncbi:hypothetical protein GCM10017687_59910 [Streptomyces echinatus]
MPFASSIAIAASGISGGLTGSAREVWSEYVIAVHPIVAEVKSASARGAAALCAAVVNGVVRLSGTRGGIGAISSILPTYDEIIR